ncbi:hypothetical protein BV25DRAFT_1922356 [Artomyces pyxidatus]|uniref:Uncharacterized protein n=1 Tax=Artomyces pyxidatus TaxID=48021 RepID=A0ACB8SEP2_9AGAM|nr:hypothetical protein BV25DRAFT_1922356 [Artomyces pyxidatus]
MSGRPTSHLPTAGNATQPTVVATNHTAHQLSAHTELPPLVRRDFPEVPFWRKNDWTAAKKNGEGVTDIAQVIGAKGNSRASKGINVKMRYISEEDGTIIDGYVASDIRKLARTIWKELLDHGLAPTQWGQVSRDASDHYIWKVTLCYGFLYSNKIAATALIAVVAQIASIERSLLYSNKFFPDFYHSSP